MCEMDEDILKLNQRITGLLTENVNLAEANQRLKRDLDRIKSEIEEHRRSAIESCELTDKYKFDLEKEIQIREAIFEAHQKQKSKFLSLNEENYLLKERVKSLENMIELRRPSQPLHSTNRFSIMGTLSELQIPEGNKRSSLSQVIPRRSTAPSRQAQEDRLRLKIEKLNKELAESYELINSLEFELDSIVYYENEVKDLRAKLDALTVTASKNTNPFDSSDDDSVNNDADNSDSTYGQLGDTESEEKKLKRIELQNQLKRFHAKQEAGTSSASRSPAQLPDLHESLKTI